MNLLTKIGAVAGGGVLLTALASGGSQNVPESPVAVPTAQEQPKTLPKPTTATITPQDKAVEVKNETVPKNVPTAPKATSEVPAKPKPTNNCHPSYSGCLKMNAGDYDCAEGSGNGPNYTGPVQVYGSDPFDLDRDNDGWGCE